MYVISLDLGTSGFRSQLIDLEKQETVKTVITMGHPLPGGNVMDHLDFAIVTGTDVAHRLMIETVKEILIKFNVEPEKIQRIAVCGNPIQLSLFQNMEIRDLAYAGENKQASLGVKDVKRDARIFPANELFGDIYPMDNCEIIVPPAIKHEIGADALAMMLETDFIHQTEPCLVTDYGTNAEMALKIGERIITASAAAGPAIEGQGIACGMLAGPGAISDVNSEGDWWRLTILDDTMTPIKGPLVDPITGDCIEGCIVRPKGITGTGVISTIALALKEGLIEKLPHLPNGKLILGNNIVISDKDVEEVGKAIGAIRAAHMTLMVESGMKYEDLRYSYMSGATGTYVDADKARHIGSVPGFSKGIVQFGNTSIGLARKIAIDRSKLDEVIDIAKKIQADHLMMATSETFKDIYVCELSTWQHGMPAEMYAQMLEMYGIPVFPQDLEKVDIEKRVSRDIDDVGYLGLDIVKDIGITLEAPVEKCILCQECVEECPEDALEIIEENGARIVNIDSQHCLGTSCRRCVTICPEQTMKHSLLKIKE
ncbi:methylamine methyltransferase corrinoid protein reductive activase [Methanolobus sediminis]|uniref:Methylamine methyltransferase corrinoid protein reductive activase n=1 Tax=Methanolobus sediminis TaxID=3072978 RepID=A0AA51UNM2_9EURY|nr:methylamine methyltransferase corrinoid protein reductive activase [Methanolobus sediminis]WMW26373.1 methylamine methyltransferase corrinoid protein reductive activase [Methanolobus sediminis]